MDTFFLSHDFNVLRWLDTQLSSTLLDAIQQRPKDREYVIYGIGPFGMMALNCLRAHGYRFGFIADQHPDYEQDFLGVPLVRPENMAFNDQSVILLCVPPDQYGDVLERIHKTDGYDGQPIITLFDRFGHITAYDTADADPAISTLGMDYLLYKIIYQLVRSLNFVWPQDKMHSKFCIYGAGLAGFLSLYYLRQMGVDVVSFSDRNPEFHGKHFLGVPVVEPDMIAQQGATDVIVTTAPGSADSVIAMLKESTDQLSSIQFLYSSYEELQRNSDLGYSLLEYLGSGTNAMVFKAQAPDGKLGVLKQYLDIRTLRIHAHEHRLEGRLEHEFPHCILPYETVTAGRDYKALFYQDRDLMPIPQQFTNYTAVIWTCLEVFLRFQRFMVTKMGRMSTELVQVPNVLCDKQGNMHLVDTDWDMEIQPGKLKMGTIALLLGLHGPGIERFYAKYKPLPEVAYDESLYQSLVQEFTAYKQENSAPQWLYDIVSEVIDLDEDALLREETYSDFIDRYCIGTRLPEDLLLQILSTNWYLPANYHLMFDRDTFHEERTYQHFRFKPGSIEPLPTSGTEIKYALFKQHILPEIQGKTYADLGSNHGFFVIKGALEGARMATGLDSNFTNNYSAMKTASAVGVTNVDFHTVDIPSPCFKQTFDVVSAYAIIHHLYFWPKEPVSLEEIVGYLADMTNETLFIEFPLTAEHAYEHYDNFQERKKGYTEDIFRQAMEGRFKTVECLGETIEGRVMYAGREKRP